MRVPNQNRQASIHHPYSQANFVVSKKNNQTHIQHTKSLCKTLCAWQKAIPRSIWYMKL